VTPEAALDGYLAGVRSGDIQAMGAMWGDHRGPARNSMVQEDYEKRLLIMQCLLRHNVVTRRSGPTAKGDTVMIGMELRSGNRGATTTAQMLRGPSGRWFVLTFDPVPNLCPDR
jgi:hypothetical protein